jgi:hypothetical protein
MQYSWAVAVPGSSAEAWPKEQTLLSQLKGHAVMVLFLTENSGNGDPKVT